MIVMDHVESSRQPTQETSSYYGATDGRFSLGVTEGPLDSLVPKKRAIKYPKLLEGMSNRLHL